MPKSRDNANGFAYFQGYKINVTLWTTKEFTEIAARNGINFRESPFKITVAMETTNKNIRVKQPRDFRWKVYKFLNSKSKQQSTGKPDQKAHMHKQGSEGN